MEYIFRKENIMFTWLWNLFGSLLDYYPSEKKYVPPPEGQTFKSARD